MSKKPPIKDTCTDLGGHLLFSQKRSYTKAPALHYTTLWKHAPPFFHSYLPLQAAEKGQVSVARLLLSAAAALEGEEAAAAAKDGRGKLAEDLIPEAPETMEDLKQLLKR